MAPSQGCAGVPVSGRQDKPWESCRPVDAVLWPPLPHPDGRHALSLSPSGRGPHLGGGPAASLHPQQLPVGVFPSRLFVEEAGQSVLAECVPLCPSHKPSDLEVGLGQPIGWMPGACSIGRVSEMFQLVHRQKVLPVPTLASTAVSTHVGLSPSGLRTISLLALLLWGLPDGRRV